MAIAFDATTTFTYNATAATSRNYNHTCSGTDRILFVATVNNGSGVTMSSCTYAGVSMTNLGNVVNANNSNITLWWLVNPASWSNSIVFTASASCNLHSKCISYTGAKQSGLPDASSTGWPTTTTSYSQSVTTVADNCWAVMVWCAMSWLAITAWSNTNIRSPIEVSLAWMFMADTNSAKTPAWTDTMTITSSSQAYTWVMVSFAPAVAAPATTPAFFLNFI